MDRITSLRLWHCLLAAILVSFTVCGSLSAMETQIISKDMLEKQFSEIIAAEFPLGNDNLSISGVTVQPENLEVPAGEIRYQLINRPRADRLGRKIITLAILVNDQDYGQVRMQGDVRLQGDVLYTTRALKRDTVLGPDDFRITRRDISMLGPDLVIDPAAAVGKKINTSLTAGAILYVSLLTEPNLVDRGDLVTIQIRSANLLVTTPGEVRNAGAAGDLVRVKNLMSRKEIYARVVSAGTVEAINR